MPKLTVTKAAHDAEMPEQFRIYAEHSDALLTTVTALSAADACRKACDGQLGTAYIDTRQVYACRVRLASD